MADVSKCPTCHKSFFNIILLKFPSTTANNNKNENGKQGQGCQPFKELKEHLVHFGKRFPMTVGDPKTSMIDVAQFALFVNNRDTVRERPRIERKLLERKSHKDEDAYTAYLERVKRLPYRNIYNRIIPPPIQVGSFKSMYPFSYPAYRMVPTVEYRVGSIEDLESKLDLDHHCMAPVSAFSYDGMRVIPFRGMAGVTMDTEIDRLRRQTESFSGSVL